MKHLLSIIAVLFSTLLFSQANPSLSNLSLNADENILFRGFKNHVQIVSEDENAEYYLLGSNCTISTMQSPGVKLPKNEYVVKPGKGQIATINLMKTVDGKSSVVSKHTYDVKNLPAALIFIDDIASGGNISREAVLIEAKYPKEIPLEARFDVTGWTMLIDGTIYTGNNYMVTEDVKAALKEIETGTIIELTVVVEGRDDKISRKVGGNFKVN